MGRFPCAASIALALWLLAGPVAGARSRATGSRAPFVTRLRHGGFAPASRRPLRPVLDSFGAAAGALPTPGTEVSTRQLQALWSGSIRPGHSLRGGGPGGAGGRLGAVAPEGRPRAVSRLSDLYGSEYVGVLGVGTREGPNGTFLPEAELRVVYDTGSADLWAASDLCSVGPCLGKGRRRYNHSRSASFRAPGLADDGREVVALYGSGKLQGQWGVDDVQLGPLHVHDQMLGLIKTEDGNAFEDLPLDGVVGLGFRSLASSTPLFDNIMAQGLLPKQEFAFYLHVDPAQGGAVLWGGYDERLFEGPLEWYSANEGEGYWAIDLVSLRFGNVSFDPKNWSGRGAGAQQRLRAGREAGEQASWQNKTWGMEPLLVVDSGTTYFAVGDQVWTELKSFVHPMRCAQVAKLPLLVYVIRDAEARLQEIAIPPEEYMVHGESSDGICWPGIVPIDAVAGRRTLLILGEIFMRYRFTVFSREGAPRVGFARAAQGPGAEALLPQPDGA